MQPLMRLHTVFFVHKFLDWHGTSFSFSYGQSPFLPLLTVCLPLLVSYLTERPVLTKLLCHLYTVCVLRGFIPELL